MKKKLFSLLLTAAMAVSLVACGGGSGAGASAGSDLRFVTGGESGTYYAFGSVIAQHATNNAGIKVVGIVGNGSQANVMEMEDGNAELAFCQSDVMAYAYEGKNLFEKPVTCFSTVAALYTEQVQIVTLDPSIQTVADLKGKKVSIGAAGSGVYFNAIDILGVYGLTETDIEPTYQSFGDSADALKDGKIDAAFVVAGAPTTAITDLATTKQVSLVALDAEHIDKLLASSPYYTKCTITKDTYNTASDIETVGVGAVVLAKNDVPEDVIYKFVSDLFENAESQVSAHAKYGELNLDYATSITSVPYHPGAAKYFEEKGYKVAK
ncbi:MAG: TAXI family TRAP transporter solute-binding subunit [Lachnospiraceae bacterium]|nr:TAXI family TRAP transporter solute-binding subunit [Lachnospiraceae bacterium]